MKKTILLALSLLPWALPASAWGPKGHDVTACIAECNLTPEAAAEVDRVLNGYSPVYWSNWLDAASHTPEYAYTKSWHYMDVDAGETRESTPRNPKGDILSALNELVRRLEGHDLPAEEEALCLKMLIHLMGDLHCPMHAGHLTDLGGNRVKVRFFGRDTNLHAVWDSSLPEWAHKWSYTEWQSQIDRLTDEEVAEITGGTLETWYDETQALCPEIYASTPEGANLSYDYVNKYAPLVERQLLKGGHRLAALLNEIYR
ncbi:S1/P1 nuclease [uncultured Alistipes sp.]|uniref:S1/P1 nuclease n=1 Tax=uncultured Alistipes sp. TaxID=538949 RepID=UPI0025DBD209|nr:S1/P1 nuclease [uncultured Alistipes sp.]